MHVGERIQMLSHTRSKAILQKASKVNTAVAFSIGRRGRYLSQLAIVFPFILQLYRVSYLRTVFGRVRGFQRMIRSACRTAVLHPILSSGMIPTPILRMHVRQNTWRIQSNIRGSLNYYRFIGRPGSEPKTNSM